MCSSNFKCLFYTWLTRKPLLSYLGGAVEYQGLEVLPRPLPLAVLKGGHQSN